MQDGFQPILGNPFFSDFLQNIQDKPLNCPRMLWFTTLHTIHEVHFHMVFFEAALINVFLAALIIAAPQFPVIITIFASGLLITVTGAIIWVAKVSEDKTEVLKA